MTAIAAVVVRWRGGEEVARCLGSVLWNGGERLAEVVLVDSGSGDGGGEALAARFPSVRLLGLESNRGFAAAANAGVAASGARAVLLLNPDTELEAGSLDRLAAPLEADPGIPGTVPLLIGPDGRSQHRWQLRRLPSALRLALGLPGAAAFTTAPSEPAPVPQPAAAAWLLRRSVWDELGGLDAEFAPAWWEDVDLCARLAHRAGRGFVVIPDARIRHLGGSSVASLSDEAFLTGYHRNLVRYAHRHHPGQAGKIVAVLRLALAARAVARPARRTAYLAARKAVGRAVDSVPDRA